LRLLLATGNPGKVREIARVLKAYDIALDPVAVEVPETRSDDVSEIARDKARDALLLVGRPLIVDDTGLFLEAYPGFPGALSKWVVSRIGVAGILRLLDGGSHAAHFRSAVAYAEPGGRTQVFVGTAEGELRRESGPAAEPSLPYDPWFAPRDGDGRVYSEMDVDAKLALSSRARAAHAFAAWWLVHRSGAGSRGSRS
jgi:XTP/dITP diphosphohydrolase